MLEQEDGFRGDVTETVAITKTETVDRILLALLRKNKLPLSEETLPPILALIAARQDYMARLLERLPDTQYTAEKLIGTASANPHFEQSFRQAVGEDERLSALVVSLIASNQGLTSQLLDQLPNNRRSAEQLMSAISANPHFEQSLRQAMGEDERILSLILAQIVSSQEFTSQLLGQLPDNQRSAEQLMSAISANPHFEQSLRQVMGEDERFLSLILAQIISSQEFTSQLLEELPDNMQSAEKLVGTASANSHFKEAFLQELKSDRSLFDRSYAAMMEAPEINKEILDSAKQNHPALEGLSEVIVSQPQSANIIAKRVVSENNLQAKEAFIKTLSSLSPYLSDELDVNEITGSALQGVEKREDIWPAILDHITDNGRLLLKGAEIEFVGRDDLPILLNEIFLRQDYFFTTDVPDPFIIDGGANFGLASYYFQNLFPESKVIAFEPGAKAYAALRSNIERMGSGNVTARPYALFDEKTELEFFEPTITSMGGSLTDRMKQYGREVTAYTVETCLLSEYIDRPVDFLKLDIEGVERKVLSELGDKLSLVDKLFVEVHFGRDQHPYQEHLAEIINLLDRHQFDVRISQAAAGEDVVRPARLIESRTSLGIWAVNKKEKTEELAAE